MDELEVRPSIKLIKAVYTAIFALTGVLLFLGNNYLPQAPIWPFLLPLALLIWPVRHHIARRFTRLAVAGDKLRYEAGVFAKTTRTMQITKVQDVCVDQTLAQRLLGVGDLSIETAGETSRLTIRNIDRPDQVSDAILEFRRKRTTKGKSE